MSVRVILCIYLKVDEGVSVGVYLQVDDVGLGERVY